MNPGLLLDYSIGQYDNYTPIQLVQYAATIANGGKKVQPKLVNTATEVNTDYTVYENKTQVLSALPGSKEDLETIQMGFREVVENKMQSTLSSHWMWIGSCKNRYCRGRGFYQCFSCRLCAI